MIPRRDLPLVGAPPVERADAVRNRTTVLAIARRLVEERGPDGLTMDCVASTAGVGKGTIFRHFGSREGLMGAVLSETEAAWQAEVLSGPPPLGPGAPPRERLEAFCRSRLEVTSTHEALLRAAGDLGSRSAPAYGFQAMHVQLLLRDLGATGDLTVAARLLLAGLDLVTVRAAREAGVDDDALTAGWLRLVDGLVAPSDGAAT